MLGDCEALVLGKRQIHDSQAGRDPQTNQFFVLPLEDTEVDLRRAQVGLLPMANYLSLWQIKWDVEQYKIDLPAIGTKSKAY